VTTQTFPTDGLIESYDPFDALGWIKLDGGDRVRFGRSACSFEPPAGNRVRVIDATPGPLGHRRATRVESLGDRSATFSERVVLMRQVLLRPVNSYSDWALACHLQWDRPEHAASYQAIREELGARGVSHAAIEEMASLARWAADVLSPRNGMVQHAIGNEDDVVFAIETAAARGIISVEKADRIRALMKTLRS
jgi:hypothetical protein